MNVVDSSCWMEYIARSPSCERFSAVIEDVEHLVVPTITIYEVFKKMLEQRNSDEAMRAAAYMRKAHTVDLTFQLATAAATVSRETGLPLADSIILATAQAYDAVLWTQDAHFKHLDNVRYFEKK